MDKVMVVDNVPEDFPCDMLKARLLETYSLSVHEKMDVLFKSEPLCGQKQSHRCWPACWPTVPLAWKRPSCSFGFFGQER